MKHRLRKTLSLMLAAGMLLSVISLPATGFAATMTPYETAKLDTNNLAAHMDEPLYTAIYDTYNNSGTPKLDADQNGVITSVEASNWSGTVINLPGLGLTGGIRGIGTFRNLVLLSLAPNLLTGNIPAEIGNLSKLVELNLSSNNFDGDIPSSIGTVSTLKRVFLNSNRLSGTIPESVKELQNLTTFHLQDNRLSGVMPSLSTTPTSIDVIVSCNLDLIPLSQKASNWSFYTSYKTAASPEYDLDRISLDTNYATNAPQDGARIMLNQDTDSDGRADVNLAMNGRERPNYNIDVNDDDKADLNVIMDSSIGNGVGQLRSYNQATALTLGGNFVGWVRPDLTVSASATAADFEVGPYPYYLELKPTADPNLITPTPDVDPPTILDPDGQPATPGGALRLNLDTNNDGVPDVNVTTKSDSKPYFNIDHGNAYAGDEIAHFNLGDGTKNPVQDSNPLGSNYDADKDGWPDTNIDLNGDSDPDINIDTNGDGEPDLNIDTTGDGTPDTNITDGTGKLIKGIPVTVTAAVGGTATGTGKYDAGNQVTITAHALSGYEFAGWTSSSSGVVFADKTKATTTFVMPNHSADIIATFRATTAQVLDVVTVSSLKASQKTLYIARGKKAKLPLIINANKTEKLALSWKASKKAVASIKSTKASKGSLKLSTNKNQSLTIKAGKKTGTSKITLNANGKKLVITVKVVKRAKAVAKKSVKIKGLPKKSTLKVAKSATLKAAFTKGATAVVTWKSSQPKVVKIDASGKITALKKGKATITLKVGGKSKKVVIKVK